jgi:hypothetical protein
MKNGCPHLSRKKRPIPPVRIRRIKENIPIHLVRIVSGQALFNILDGSMRYQFDHDDASSVEEVELLSDFFQEAQDWGDLLSDQEAGEREDEVQNERHGKDVGRFGISAFWCARSSAPGRWCGVTIIFSHSHSAGCTNN